MSSEWIPVRKVKTDEFSFFREKDHSGNLLKGKTPIDAQKFTIYNDRKMKKGVIVLPRGYIIK
jgi:hypothetical protein